MNKTRLIAALVVLLGLIAAVVVTTRSRESASKVESPSATLPSIKKEEITQIEITKPQQAPVVLAKQGDKWRLTAPLETEPAQASIDSVLEKLSDLKVTGVAATRKENHAKLEVDDEHAIRVLAKAGDKQLADLRVGAAKSGGTMVRVSGEEPVLAVKGSIRYAFDKELKDWRKREITEFEAKQLAAISISSDKGSFKFEQNEDKWAQAKGEKPIDKFDADKVASLASTLANLRAADFADARDGDEVTGLNAPRAKVTLTKKDGSNVELTLGKEHASGEHYLRASTSPVVFRVAKYTAERLMPDPKAFEKAEEKPAAQPPGGAPPLAGGGELPPEIMQQLQKQLAAQGRGGHP